MSNLDYPTHSTYLPCVIQGMAPAVIDFFLHRHDVPSPRENHPKTFRYLDLGCGYGATLLCLAAAYPDAEFIGVDANCEHIQTAQRIATSVGLENITFLAQTFDSDQVWQLPSMDCINSHGVLTG